MLNIHGEFYLPSKDQNLVTVPEQFVLWEMGKHFKVLDNSTEYIILLRVE